MNFGMERAERSVMKKTWNEGKRERNEFCRHEFVNAGRRNGSETNGIYGVGYMLASFAISFLLLLPSLFNTFTFFQHPLLLPSPVIVKSLDAGN